MEDNKHLIYLLVRKARSMLVRLADELSTNPIHCDRYGWMGNYLFAMLPVSGINQPMDARLVVDQIARWNTFVLMCKPLIELDQQTEMILSEEPLSPVALEIIGQIREELARVFSITENILNDLANGYDSLDHYFANIN